MANKSELRKEYLLKRKSLTNESISGMSREITTHFQSLYHQFSCQTVHTFLTIEKQKEIDTQGIVRLLFNSNARVVVSKSDFKDHTLSHYVIDSETVLVTNDWGIPEPVDAPPISVNTIDMVVIPLVIFDRKGYRVGYGKGFYDKFLSECREETIKVGLSLFDPVDIIPFDTHDIPMNYCITPEKVYDFDRI